MTGSVFFFEVVEYKEVVVVEVDISRSCRNQNICSLAKPSKRAQKILFKTSKRESVTLNLFMKSMAMLFRRSSDEVELNVLSQQVLTSHIQNQNDESHVEY